MGRNPGADRAAHVAGDDGSPSRQFASPVVDQPVAPGDYVLNHVGFAIRRIPAEEIAETLALYEELLAADDEDMMAADVRGEIEAAGTRRPGNGAP